MKISKVISLYWLDKKLEFSENTIKTYSYTFKYLVEFLKDCEFETVQHIHIREFVLFLEEERGLGKRSLSDSVTIISSLWTWANTELKVPHIFAEKRIKIKFTQPIKTPFTQSEIKTLLSHAEYKADWITRTTKKSVRSKRPTHLLDKAIILTLLDTGMRVTELCNLIISDYDENSGKILIRSAKNYKQRYVIVGLKTRKTLFKYLDSRKNVKPNYPLFATTNDTHFDRNNIRHKLESIAKAANISNVHPHRFRHTFAIQFLRNGGNLLLLKELIGHSSLEMVKYYAKIAETDIDNAHRYSVSDNWRL